MSIAKDGAIRDRVPVGQTARADPAPETRIWYDRVPSVIDGNPGLT